MFLRLKPDVSVSHASDLIKLINHKNKSYLSNGDLMGVRRDIFDLVNGYNSFSDLSSSNDSLLTLIEKQNHNTIEVNQPSFGVRSNLFNYNFTNNNFN